MILITLTDFLYGCGFWVIAVIIIALIVGKHLSKNGRQTIVSRDADADAAIDTLIGLGFSREDAETRVFEARRDSQDADFQELVNLAVKNR